VGLVGTLSEVTVLREVDETELPAEAPVLSALEDRYRKAMRGTEPHEAIELSVRKLETASQREMSASTSEPE